MHTRPSRNVNEDKGTQKHPVVLRRFGTTPITCSTDIHSRKFAFHGRRYCVYLFSIELTLDSHGLGTKWGCVTLAALQGGDFPCASADGSEVTSDCPTTVVLSECAPTASEMFVLQIKFDKSLHVCIKTHTRTLANTKTTHKIQRMRSAGSALPMGNVSNDEIYIYIYRKRKMFVQSKRRQWGREGKRGCEAGEWAG